MMNIHKELPLSFPGCPPSPDPSPPFTQISRHYRITRWIATRLLGGGELRKATWEEAERNLAFAEERAPGVSEHHLQLANLYADTEPEPVNDNGTLYGIN